MKPQSLAPGTIVKDYEIVRLIAEGGMGAVYEAKVVEIRKTVAVKQTFFSEEYLRKAFKREAQILAGLRHPMLPDVSAHFFEGDDQFLVMQYIQGNDLAAEMELNGTSFEPAEVLRWVDQLLGLLEFLHGQREPIIHRDIKPHNIKLTPREELFLLDFGLAKGTPSDVTGLTTGVTTFGYSIYYAALEQIRGQVTSATSDLFSLAATAYHLLTNQKPVHALERLDNIGRQLPDPLSFANELNPHVPEPIARTLMQCMALYPDKRPPTARVMRELLRDAARSSSIAIERQGVAAAVKVSDAYRPSSRERGPIEEKAKGASPGATDPAAAILTQPVERPEETEPAPTVVVTTLEQELEELPITVIGPPQEAREAGWRLASEFQVACENAWPVGGRRILTSEDHARILTIRDGDEVVWQESFVTPVRCISRGPADQCAVATWDGQIRCFAGGELVASTALSGTVGDVQFGADGWLAGTWKRSLASIPINGKVTPLLDVEMGVFRIAVRANSDWFSVADLGGGIALYSGGARKVNIPSVGAISSLAFAGPRLIVLAGESLITIELDGRVGAPEPLPGRGNARLLPAPEPGGCLLLTDDGACWSISKSLVYQLYFNFGEGQIFLSSCSVPKRFTVAGRNGGCCYWRNSQENYVWNDATSAHLSADGRLIVVVFPGKVQLYEDAK